MRVPHGRTGYWLALVTLSLLAACDSGPTGPCFDPTDSGGCHTDSTHVTHARAHVTRPAPPRIAQERI